VSEQRSDLEPDRTQSVGLYLAGQRRLRGVSIDELAERTRIPRRNIERLEAGAFDATPDGFSRGFVRTVAEALGLDSDEAVMRLMSEPIADEADRARARSRMLVVRAALLVVALFGCVMAARLAISALAREPAEAPEVVYRRDAVRALATAGGAGPHDAGAGSSETGPSLRAAAQPASGAP
jgi:hypothetical protein